MSIMALALQMLTKWQGRQSLSSQLQKMRCSKTRNSEGYWHGKQSSNIVLHNQQIVAICHEHCEAWHLRVMPCIIFRSCILHLTEQGPHFASPQAQTSVLKFSCHVRTQLLLKLTVHCGSSSFALKSFLPFLPLLSALFIYSPVMLRLMWQTTDKSRVCFSNMLSVFVMETCEQIVVMTVLESWTVQETSISRGKGRK